MLAAFVYDADGQRVLGSVGGVTTVYVGGVYEYVVGTGATTYYYEGNALRRTGHAGDNGVFYLLQDHLHSSSALAAQNGTLSGAKNYYYPFGGSRGGAFNALTAKRFTGQYHEQSIPGGEGLSYYGARWYDARLGRFVTPDSIVPKPDNPQDFNRYSYVRNNPLKYIDPSGHVAGSINHDPWSGGGGGLWLSPVAARNLVLGIAALFALIRTASDRGVQSSAPLVPPRIQVPRESVPLATPRRPNSTDFPLDHWVQRGIITPVAKLPSYQEFFPRQRYDSSPYLVKTDHQWLGDNALHEHQDSKGEWFATTDLPGGRQAAESLFRLMGGRIPPKYEPFQMEPLKDKDGNYIVAIGSDYEARFRPWSGSKSPAIDITYTNVNGTVFHETIHFP